jgi:hypothetical protein
MSTAGQRPRSGAARDVWIWVAAGTALLVIVGMVAFVAMRHTPSGSGAAPAMAMDGGYQRHPMAMPARDTQMPDYASRAGMTDLYRYALANADVLTYIPCTCGCASMGHLSNWNCYVRDVVPDGTVTFDPHATGCETCVLITRDVIEMRARGTPLSEIRDYIDANYAGLSTDTEYPPTV